MDKTEYLTLPDGKRIEIACVIRCCRAIEKIKAILQEDTMDDKECFWKIEEIVMVFEDMELDAGRRHDS